MQKKVVAKKDINEWLFTIVDQESLIINRSFDSENKIADTLDITSNLWYFAIVKIKGDALFYIRDDDKIVFTEKRYGVFYPKYSICRIGLDKAKVDIDLFASSSACQSYFPDCPVIFEVNGEKLPQDIENVRQMIRFIKNPIEIGISSKPSGIGQKIKQEIDSSYLSSLSFSSISSKIGISSSLMSSYFKKAYYITPSQYRKNLRIISSIEKLLYLDKKSGTVPSVAFDSGYNDLSRYYKQFKSIVGLPPGKIVV